MVTLDKIVENVGKFKGNIIIDNDNYEKALANIELLKNDKSMQDLEETLKKNTGYDDFNLPWVPNEYDISIGGINFMVKSEKTTKRPQYKSAVEQMENYLVGINLLLSENRVITGVAKENDLWCISVDSLLENYEVILAGVRYPGIKQTIKYKAEGVTAPDKWDISKEKDGTLTEENFKDYVMKDLLMNISTEFVKAYQKGLGTQKKFEGVIPVSSDKAYKPKPIKTEGTDWGYVAKTLVNDDSKALGELNMLADQNTSFEDKQTNMPYYTLFLREPFGEEKVYVSINSIHNRIQSLKNERTITREGTTYEPKSIV